MADRGRRASKRAKVCPARAVVAASSRGNPSPQFRQHLNTYAEETYTMHFRKRQWLPTASDQLKRELYYHRDYIETPRSMDPACRATLATTWAA